MLTIFEKCYLIVIIVYLLILGSGGLREVETLSIRHRDIDFTTNPTTIHIREDKTGEARDRYISDETTFHLKKFMEWKEKRVNQVQKMT